MSKQQEERFVVTYKEGKMTQRVVLVDRKTGVNYLYVGSGYGGGLSVLLDAEGSPIVTELEE